MEVLDEAQVDVSRNEIEYGGFWIRFGAQILDTIVLAPVIAIVSYFNVISWKSTMLLILFSIIAMAYKPFMEYNYGATVGKMIVRLKVVNLEFENPSIQDVLMRNIFNIVSALINLALTIYIFSLPDFQDIDGFLEFGSFSSVNSKTQWVTWGTFFVSAVDAIVLVADKQKRSLHDMIGNTYVVVKP